MTNGLVIGSGLVDRDGTNNRRENLREVTRAKNLENRKWPVGKSGYRGVTKDGNKFTTQFHHDGTLVRVRGSIARLKPTSP